MRFIPEMRLLLPLESVQIEAGPCGITSDLEIGWDT